MNRDKLTVMGNGNNTNYMALLNSLVAATKIEESKLTPEQKILRNEARRIKEDQEIKRVKILKNICPECGGKLIRGKKDKKNDYKRSWKCVNCESVFSM